MTDEVIYSSSSAPGELAIGALDLNSLDEGEIRRLKVESLAQGGDTTSVIAYLADPDWRVRRAAAHALADSPGHNPAVLLCDRLASEDAGERNAAIKALIRLGQDAVPALTQSLGSEDPDVRNFTCIALGQIGGPTAAPALRRLLTSEPDPNVRYMAIEAVGRLGDRGAVETLDALLDEEVWFAAPSAEALGTIGGSRAIAALLRRVDHEQLAPSVITALGAAGDLRAILPLLALIPHAEDGRIRTILSAVSTIVRSADDFSAVILERLRPAAQRLFTAEANRALMEMLRLPGEPRTDALHVAAWFGDASITPAVCLAADDSESTSLVVRFLARDILAVRTYLADGLRNPSPAIRMSIAEAIGVSGDRDSRDLLLSLLDDENHAVCCVAIRALMRTGSAEDAVAVLPLMKSDLEEVRDAAAEALRGLGISHVIDELLELASSSSDATRQTVARALSIVGDIPRSPSLCAALLSLARDPVPGVRAAVIPAIASGPCHDVRTALMALAVDENETVRVAGMRSVGGLTGPATSRLLRTGYTDGSILVRMAAITGLAAVATDDGRALILDVFAGRDVALIITALAALGSTGCSDLVETVVCLTEHESADVREAALHCLARISPSLGQRRAASVLEKSQESSWHVRHAAVETLAHCPEHSSPHALLQRAVHDENPVVARAATHALAMALGPDSVQPLVMLLDDDHVGDVAAKELSALGTDAVTALSDVLPDLPTRSRRRAIATLGMIGTDTALAALEEIIRSGDDDDRWWSLIAIMHIGSEGSRMDDLPVDTFDGPTRAILHATMNGMAP